tara:strand:+ start:195 stop:1358 length:1164 start_codon:yes stop_codon:yes gene_type:complete
MSISSFQAGLIRSLGEGLKEDRLRAEATAEKRAEQHALEVRAAKSTEKKIRVDLKRKVAEIKSIAKSAKVNLSPTVVSAIMENPKLFEEYKTIAKDRPSKLQDFVKADGDEIVDVKQRIELNAQQAYKDITGFVEPAGRTFIPGLDVDTSRITEQYAAEVGMTPEEFRTVQAKQTIDPLDIQVDKSLLSKETPTTLLDRSAVTLFNEVTKPDGGDPEVIKTIQKERALLNSMGGTKKPTTAEIRARLNQAIGTFTQLTAGKTGSSVKFIDDGAGGRQLILEFTDPKDVNKHLGALELAVRPILNSTLGITDKSEEGPILEDLRRAAKIDGAYNSYVVNFIGSNYLKPGPSKAEKLTDGDKGKSKDYQGNLLKLKSGKNVSIMDFKEQ